MRIEVKNLVQQFYLRKLIARSREDGEKRAVDDVSFSLEEGELCGLIGHSGCGKTTIARTISALLKPSSGEILYNGENIFEMDKKRFKEFRKEVRVIFQNPDSCLNPHMKIKDIVAEVFKIHTNLTKKEIEEKILNLFEMIGLNASFLARYPYQLSIGQKRQVGLARALAVVPRFLIADEPFSGLDISTKMELTSTIKRLQEKHKFGALIISHDLKSVSNLCRRVAIMYRGRMVELFNYSILTDKKVYHPYTQILLRKKNEGEKILILRRKFHPEAQKAIGCAFLNRCYLYDLFDHPLMCAETRPELRMVQDNHHVACHFCDRVLRGGTISI